MGEEIPVENLLHKKRAEEGSVIVDDPQEDKKSFQQFLDDYGEVIQALLGITIMCCIPPMIGFIMLILYLFE